jgi:glycerol-3-phosphate dehydrogenase subunit B
MSDQGRADDDVVVIGGGLAGYVAALTAALEEPVASVRLLAPETDRFERETGLVDLLGYTPDGDGPLAEPLGALDGLPATHPYSRVGVEEVRTALSLFEEVTGYDGLDSDANALVPTCNGNVKPTYMYPESVTPGLASKDGECLLVGFGQVADLHADYVADKLDSKLPYDVESTSISLPVDTDDEEDADAGIIAEKLAEEGDIGEADEDSDVEDTVDADERDRTGDEIDQHPVLALAAALDENVEFEGRLPARRAVAGKIRNALDIEPRIGFPAVLGLDAAADVRSDLESILQADPFEIPLGPPSLLGLRLEQQLRSELDDAGVTVEPGVSLTDFDVEDGHIRRVSTPEQSYEAAEFVLATGGLAAGGLESTPEQIVEPVFDCHVTQPDERGEWVAADFLDDHPFARLGLAVNDQFRPLDDNDQPTFENLRAAGRILGGGDFAAEQSASGVAVVTGHRVGTISVEW